MGPLSDSELDGLIASLGLPEAARPLTPVQSLLGPAAAGLAGWKMVASLLLAAGFGFGGGVILSREESAPPAAVTVSLPSLPLALPGDAPPTSLPVAAPGSASLPARRGAARTTPAVAAASGVPEVPGVPGVPGVPEAPLSESVGQERPNLAEIPEIGLEIPHLRRHESDAAPRVRMVASVSALDIRGGGVPSQPDGALLAELTVTGRTGARTGPSPYVAGSLDAGARLGAGAPRLSAGLTGAAGLSIERGERRLDLGWALSGRVSADGGLQPREAPRHPFDGDRLSTGPTLALSLGEVDGARVRLGASALFGQAPPTLGLSLGVDLAPWG